MNDLAWETPLGLMVVAEAGALTGRDRGPLERAEDDACRQRMGASRYASHLLGRSAAHLALARWLPEPVHSRTEVLRGPLGQPTAVVGNASVAEVTLSHSGEWACALVSSPGRPFGIDLEERSPATSATARKSLARTGQWKHRPGPGIPDDLAALVAWTAREAAGKALKTGLAVASEVLDVETVDSGDSGTYDVRFRRLPMLRGTTHFLDDVVVSFATFLRHGARMQMTRLPPGDTPRSAHHYLWRLNAVRESRVDHHEHTFISP